MSEVESLLKRYDEVAKLREKELTPKEIEQSFIHSRAKNDRFLVLGYGKSEQQVVKEAEKVFILSIDE